MATENAMKFYEELQNNEELKAKASAAKGPEDLVAIAVDAGFDITWEDLEAVEWELRKSVARTTDGHVAELSEGELDDIAGGELWLGETAPDGHEMGCFLPYHGRDWQYEHRIRCKACYYYTSGYGY